MSHAMLCEQLALTLLRRGWLMSCAESCTGGLIAASCTNLSGSSRWFERGFITYSNLAKTEMLGVSASLIEAHGAVSEPVVRAMAMGALHHAQAHVSVAVTGIAGPTGGSIEKPVGTIWFGWCIGTKVSSERHCFAGNRHVVRDAAVNHALRGLLHRL